ncbi:hypothetical protein NDU88_008380 [Pleurodeles waltl]|uniref:Uncharacterized protein n=1 Tax=Pleurodeles waltl TaxID=8319 RepID=A0AAV7QRL2_PLEWA|nr:hypothetical protein NDU88_008380 [Pleurodeles waltl]
MGAGSELGKLLSQDAGPAESPAARRIAEPPSAHSGPAWQCPAQQCTRTAAISCPEVRLPTKVMIRTPVARGLVCKTYQIVIHKHPEVQRYDRGTRLTL